MDVVMVQVSGKWYEVRAYKDSYANTLARFNGLDKGGQMPWWGDSDMAQAFAKAVGNRMGYPNRQADGPFFAFNDKIEAHTYTTLITPKNKDTRMRLAKGLKDYYEWTTYAIAREVPPITGNAAPKTSAPTPNARK